MKIENRKAYFEYDIGETLMAGMKLIGSQIKPVKNGSISLSGSYVMFDRTKVSMLCSIEGQTVKIPLLMNKQEINKFRKESEQTGKTVVPLSVYMKNGFIKCDIALCKGKKLYDKREAIKQKDLKRYEAMVK